jgi:hypothetical protein
MVKHFVRHDFRTDFMPEKIQENAIQNTGNFEFST